MSHTYPLPTPYDGNTVQDHVDALRDNADLRTDGPLIDYLALAAAELIELCLAATDGRDASPHSGRNE